MNIERRIQLFVCCLFLLLCPLGAQSPFGDETNAQSQLREAIFRYMFAHYDYGSAVKVFCIQPERPLPERYLRRFASSEKPVIWASDCEIGEPMNAVKRKNTGERALVMKVQGIRWIGALEAEARVEAYSDGIAANWNVLCLARKKAEWAVIRDTPDGVS